MNDERLPAFAHWLLDALLPPDADSLKGDLAESFATRHARDGGPAANRWYRREVATTLLHIGFSRLARHHLAFVALTLGIAAAGICAPLAINGPATLLKYVGALLVLAVYMSAAGAYSVRQRLAASIGAFMTVTALDYLRVMFENPRTTTAIPLSGHAWRVGLMFVLAVLIGLIISSVSAKSLRARLALPAVFLPWLPFGFLLVIRPRWGEVSPALKVLLPFESYYSWMPSLAIYRLRGAMWWGLIINTAIWAALALLIAAMIERKRRDQIELAS